MLTLELVNGLILGSCTLGLFYAFLNAIWLSKIRIGNTEGYKEFDEDMDHHNALLLEIGSYIERGAAAFLAAEYRFMAIFVFIMAFVIFFFVE